MFEREGLGFAAVGGEGEAEAWVRAGAVGEGAPYAPAAAPFPASAPAPAPVFYTPASEHVPSGPRVRGASADADAGG